MTNIIYPIDPRTIITDTKHAIGRLECCIGETPLQLFKRKEHLYITMCPCCGFAVGSANEEIVAVAEWNKAIFMRETHRFVTYLKDQGSV